MVRRVSPFNTFYFSTRVTKHVPRANLSDTENFSNLKSIKQQCETPITRSSRVIGISALISPVLHACLWCTTNFDEARDITRVQFVSLLRV